MCELTFGKPPAPRTHPPPPPPAAPSPMIDDSLVCRARLTLLLLLLLLLRLSSSWSLGCCSHCRCCCCLPKSSAFPSKIALRTASAGSRPAPARMGRANLIIIGRPEEALLAFVRRKWPAGHNHRLAGHLWLLSGGTLAVPPVAVFSLIPPPPPPPLASVVHLKLTEPGNLRACQIPLANDGHIINKRLK